MERTVPVRTSKRKARDARLLEFDAVAEFANLGDEPKDWAGFRRQRRSFFPPDMAEWIYTNAEVWFSLTNLPPVRPANYQQMLHEDIRHWVLTERKWATLRNDIKTERPPLLFYRNLLRRIWRDEDRDGSCLNVLLGIDEADAPVLETAEQPRWHGYVLEVKGQTVPIDELVETGSLFDYKTPEVIREYTGAGIKLVDRMMTDFYLPRSKQRVDGERTIVNWDFGCQFQTDIYHLMQERWRAGICPECHKYFVRDKTHRKYCSTACCGERKRRQALDYHHRVGKVKRQEAKAVPAARSGKS